MSVLAIIPARGGSKRVPGKNLFPMAGRPLLAHTIEHAQASLTVDDVVVSTDHPKIAALARVLGADVVERPPDLAADDASSESALLHVLDVRQSEGRSEPELVVFLQCTSPVRRRDDIDRAVRLLRESHSDSVFSAVQDKGLLWMVRDGVPSPVNYEPARRRREQDMGLQLRENGSIYVFRPAVLRREGVRVGGRTAIYEMDVWTSFQFDLPEHAELLEWILRRPGLATEPEWPDRIDLVVFDFDGVMTDNGVLVAEGGDELVRCDRGDGWGVARLRDAGFELLVLSTEEHPVVAARCRKLRVAFEQGLSDKAARLKAILDERGLDAANVIYVGNDVNDLDCLQLVGMPVVVGDAQPQARAAAKLVLTAHGGHGAVRELCDLLLAR